MAQRNSSGRGATATATKRRTTSSTANINESKIGMMKVEDIRGQLRKRGVSGISALRKMDLVKSLVRTLRAEGGGTSLRKAAAKKAPAKKATAKKAPAKKATGAKKTVSAASKRTTARKTVSAASKRTTARKTVSAPTKRATAKKAPAKKATTKRAPAKKATAKKAPAKKATAKRAPAKKATAKKAPAKKAPARKATAAATRTTGTRKTTTAPVRKAAGAGTAPARKTTGARKTTARKSTAATGARKSASATKRTGAGGGAQSKSLKYSQPITSTQDQPERPGRSLVTQDHDVIQRWAEARMAQPATIEGTEREGRIGVLTFDFPGWREGGGLKPVSWDEWFHTFDLRRLNFIYQEQLSDGRQSNFFRTESPDREDG
ncbi:hypothetical protein [Plantactinospora sonchi]|uniref:Rho termination factor N-terminal domain-containing protein n=1 Tax=Plantactinospora sonchi TaxID=1544735 RepID=A0ABU7RSW9_9ACTN